MKQFRNQEINVLICTNMVSRGVDVPETDLVINFDVPTMRVQDKVQADCSTYLHRIGRCGRFGKPGLALTIYDRVDDKQHLDHIIEFYDIKG